MDFCMSNKPSLIHFWLIYHGLQMFLKHYLPLTGFLVMLKKKKDILNTTPRVLQNFQRPRLSLFLFSPVFSNRNQSNKTDDKSD